MLLAEKGLMYQNVSFLHSFCQKYLKDTQFLNAFTDQKPTATLWSFCKQETMLKSQEQLQALSTRRPYFSLMLTCCTEPAVSVNHSSSL